MKTLLDLYERNARLYPERTAFALGDRRLSYDALLTRAKRLASALRRAGLARQDRVGLFAANSIEYFEVCAGCEVGGFISALFNFRSAAPELEHLIAHSGASLVVFDSDLAAVVGEARHSSRGVRRYVCVGDDPPDWATPYEDFLAEGDPAGVADRPGEEDFCTLFYTSGTTGRPKGVPYRHAAMIRTAQRTYLEQEASLLQISPAFHVGGRCPPLGVMWSAGKTVLAHGFDPADWARTVERERINLTFMVPMMMQALLDCPDVDRYDLSSLSWVMAASTAIPPPLLTRAIGRFGNVFYVAYGSTECGGIARLRRSETRADGPPDMTARLGSVGHPETPVEMALLDDDGLPVADGGIGEICVQSHCFAGYWNDPAATADAMHGTYFRTGDMGRFDERSYLYIVDRRKDVIISGGENIYSREVEDALHRHPAVESASVIGVADAKWGERVLAAVVVRKGQAIDEAGLIAFSRTQLARYKCPKDVAFVDALPLSGTGKIDKLALRARYGTEAERA